MKRPQVLLDRIRPFVWACAAALLVGCAMWLGAESPVVAGWRGRASELRGLSFEQRVPLRWIAAQDLPDLVRSELEAMIGPEYAVAYRDAFAALGLIPADLELVELLVRLNQEQIAGFYSVRRRTMYVLAGRKPDGSPTDGAEPVVIHELVHALQHQHFPRTLELMQGLRRNDDVVLALSSAAEGDAMLTMLRSANPQGELSPDAAELMRAGMERDLHSPAGLLAEVPRIVRLSLLFPYAAGFELAERRYRADGAAGVDALLRDPPLSSQGVRSFGRAVDFVGLPAEEAAAQAGAGCRPGHDNVAGAVGIEALLADHGAQAGASIVTSWKGDRFLHVDCPDGEELLWISRWATSGAAADFAEAYREIAPRVARVAPLAGVPRIEQRGPTVLVLTPRLAPAADELLARTETRTYARFGEWVADDCFPESPCPGPR